MYALPQSLSDYATYHDAARDILAALASPETAPDSGLDVERLGEAGGNVLDGRRIGSVRLYRNTITPDDWQSIAAEYARLSSADSSEEPE